MNVGLPTSAPRAYGNPQNLSPAQFANNNTGGNIGISKRPPTFIAGLFKSPYDQQEPNLPAPYKIGVGPGGAPAATLPDGSPLPARIAHVPNAAPIDLPNVPTGPPPGFPTGPPNGLNFGSQYSQLVPLREASYGNKFGLTKDQIKGFPGLPYEFLAQNDLLGGNNFNNPFTRITGLQFG